MDVKFCHFWNGVTSFLQIMFYEWYYYDVLMLCCELMLCRVMGSQALKSSTMPAYTTYLHSMTGRWRGSMGPSMTERLSETN